MPNPRIFKGTKKEWISYCVSVVMKEGTTDDPSQAAAICYSKWRTYLKNKRSKGEQLTVEEISELSKIDLDDLKNTVDKL